MKVDRSKLKKTPTEAVSMHNTCYVIIPGPPNALFPYRGDTPAELFYDQMWLGLDPSDFLYNKIA